MIRIRLSAPDRDRLAAEFRTTADRKLRDRLQVVLMADLGRRPSAIAADLGVITRTGGVLLHRRLGNRGRHPRIRS